MGILNIFGRLLCGWIADRPNVDPLVVSNIAVIMGGIATSCLPLFDSYSAFIIYCFPFALGVASFAALRSVICADLLGMERLTNAYGFLMLFMGVAALLGPPFAAFLKSKTASFGLAFVVMGCFMILRLVRDTLISNLTTNLMFSGLISLPLRRINAWERKRDAPEHELQPLNTNGTAK
jgi:MFS family permease